MADGVTRPNIMLVHCHDLGRFLGAYGVTTVHTPNLDGLANEGTVFTEAFCVAPQCSPSRASLFTGRFPQQTGVLGLTHKEPRWGLNSDLAWDLNPDEVHVAELLRSDGYYTALIGVHHESQRRPDDEVASRLGFDHFAARGNAETVAERTIGQLAQLAGGERPFYLQVGFQEPHRIRSDRDGHGVMGFTPNNVEPDDQHGVTIPGYLHDTDTARAEIAELQGAIRYMDQAVGRILTALDEHGLADNTIVVFTTDHGVALPRAKCTLYDPGLEVALIMRVPGRSAWSHRVVDGLVSNIDILPTLLDLLGVEAPATVMGQNLVPLVETGAPGRTEIFAQLTYHQYYDPRRCVRTSRHKLIANFSSAPEVMDSSQSWNRRSMPRSVESNTVGPHPPLEIYDLEADPYELTNVADQVPASDRDALLASLMTWMHTVDDPLLSGAIPDPFYHHTLTQLQAKGQL